MVRRGVAENFGGAEISIDFLCVHDIIIVRTKSEVKKIESENWKTSGG